MSDGIFLKKEDGYLEQLPTEGNVPIVRSRDPRENNQIIKITMVFPQIGIVTYG
tara:strand:+ start:850 stop:1011 length:162 start_codon:yes stop_codon:yes gene_type:complete